MSSHSHETTCPECDGKLMAYAGNDPHDWIAGECLECGFCYYTNAEQNTLEKVNELRAIHGLEPLSKLKEKDEKPISAPPCNTTCPECKGTLIENHSHNLLSGKCLECGLDYCVDERIQGVVGHINLETVNQLRAEHGLKPLDKLKEKG